MSISVMYDKDEVYNFTIGGDELKILLNSIKLLNKVTKRAVRQGLYPDDEERATICLTMDNPVFKKLMVASDDL